MFGVGVVFAGYTIVRFVGSGGMGEVYLARHPRLPREDALKIVRPTSPMRGFASGSFGRPIWPRRCRTLTSSGCMPPR